VGTFAGVWCLGWLQPQTLPCNSRWAAELVVQGAGASTAAQCILLAAALLSVCWGSGGCGVEADSPAAAWHENTRGPRGIPQGTGTDGSDVQVKQSFGEGPFRSAGGNTN